MKKYINYVQLVIILLLVGCTSDLDQSPVSGVTDNSFWKNENDATAALGGMHNRLRNIMPFDYFQWGDMRGEAYNYGFEVTHGDGYQFYFENRLNSENSGAQWDPIYRVISEANAILHFVPSIDYSNEEEKNMTLGMAYGLRAYCYFLIARTWGDAPIVDEHIQNYSDVAALQIARSPLSEVYALIDRDIEAGLSLMSKNEIQDKYYMSRPALLAMKAEVALTKAGLLRENISQNAQVALDAINECFDSGQVNLINSFKDIFDTSNKKNQEIVWAMPYNLDEGLTTKPLASRMYVSADRYEQLESVTTGGNKDETYISFETGSFTNSANQTGNSYNAWTGGTLLNGTWIGPETNGALGWDNDGGGNSLEGNELNSPFNSVGNGYARVNASENVLIKLPSHMKDIKYVGLLAKLAGNTSSYSDVERTVDFEVSTNLGSSWSLFGSIVIDAGYAANTKLHEINIANPIEGQGNPIWIRFSTGGVRIHILDNIRIQTSSYVLIPSQDDVNPGNNSVSFNYVTYKPEVCKALLADADPRAEQTFKLLFDSDGTELGGIAYKYRGEFDASSGNRNYISDIILYRAGELKLMEAEAQLLLGNLQNAIDAIKEVRDRAGISTNITLDPTTVTAALVKEYLFETMGEGKRWFQMLRFGGGATVRLILEDLASNKYLYGKMPWYSPLSRSTLTRNPNLDQTDGY